MDSAMADCGDDGMSGEDTQCPHCARLKLELRGLRLKLARMTMSDLTAKEIEQVRAAHCPDSCSCANTHRVHACVCC